MKHKRKSAQRKCRITGTKIAAIAVLLFILAVVSAIVVVPKLFWLRYPSFMRASEAGEGSIEDISWVDTDGRLSWVANRNIYERSADDTDWDHVEGESILRTYSFGGGVEDIVLEPMYGYSAAVVPADDLRGYVLADYKGDVYSIYRVDEGGSVAPEYFESVENINHILACYGDLVYFEGKWKVWEPDEDDGWFRGGYEPFLACLNRENGEIHRYRGQALCVDSQGRAVILQPESMVSPRDEWTFTLGIEDAQGSWMPIASIGDGCIYDRAPCAVWLDADRLLFAARTESEDYKKLPRYYLYQYSLSSGKIEPWRSLEGEHIHLAFDSYPCTGDMSLSPDGCYIAYSIDNSGSKSMLETVEIMVQSLKTGRYARLAPLDAVEQDGKRFSTWIENTGVAPVWLK